MPNADGRPHLLILGGTGEAAALAAAATARYGEALTIAGPHRPALTLRIARRAREVALATLAGGIAVDVALFDRQGSLIAHADR